MQVLLAVGGSRGDIQPMLALALGLRQRGHGVRFCAPPNFAAWIEGHGLPFLPLGRDVQAFLAENGTNINRALVTLKGDLRREFAFFAAHAAGADLILGASVTCAGVSYAEKLGVPYAYVVFAPALLPSAHLPAPTLPWFGLPRWLNRLSWWGTRALWNRLFRRILNEERARMGLRPVPDVWSHIQDAELLLACDPGLAPPPADAPARLCQPGPLLLPQPEDLPAELERFLAAGPAPVYIGFGSMPDRRADRSTALIFQAVRRAGVRAVIGRGWAGLGGGSAEGTDICVVDTIAHARLFPRVAAVVHHGGAGTTHAAALAGVPQLLVPHIVDQFFWARRVQTLGLGPPAIRRGRLNVRRLAAGLRACVDEPRHGQQARALARELTRDGVGRGVAILEGLAGSRAVAAPALAGGRGPR